MYGACHMPISFLMYLFSRLLRLTWGEDWAEVPLEQSGPRKPGKQWQDPETHSPLPWQFRGHSTTDSAGKKAGSLTGPTALQCLPREPLLTDSTPRFSGKG